MTNLAFLCRWRTAVKNRTAEAGGSRAGDQESPNKKTSRSLLGACLSGGYFWHPELCRGIWHTVLISFSAAAAKSLQSCPTMCSPIDGSPLGSSVPGILQARTLEWVAISFSNAWKWKVKVKLLSRARLLVTPWTAAHQAPPSMGFSRQEYWSGVPLPSPISFSLVSKSVEDRDWASLGLAHNRRSKKDWPQLVVPWAVSSPAQDSPLGTCINPCPAKLGLLTSQTQQIWPPQCNFCNFWTMWKIPLLYGNTSRTGSTLR